MIHRSDKTTKLMRRIMKKHGHATLDEFIEAIAETLLSEQSVTGAAAVYKVSKATMDYWMQRLGIRRFVVAIPPGFQGVFVAVDSEGNATFEWQKGGGSTGG